MRVSRGREDEINSEYRDHGNYTGVCWVDTVLAYPPEHHGDHRTDETVLIYSVFFQPGHRTDWHRHTMGQYMFVTGGEGRIANDQGASAVLRAGDWVYIPAGERHWHGAGPNSFFMHYVISLGELIYDEKVSDAEYSNGF